MYRSHDTGDFIDDKHHQVIEVINEYGEFRFFVTLSYQHFVGDKEALAAASTFIKRLHWRLFGRYAWRSTERLQGVALLERADIRKRKHGRDRGNCHFHFLIKDHPNFDRHPIKALRCMQSAVSRAGSGLNIRAKNKLVSKHGTDTQLVFNKGAVEYVSKEAKHISWWHEDRLFFIAVPDLAPGSIPLRPSWNMDEHANYVPYARHILQPLK